MQPFLKWPGGKRWLISNYRQIFPDDYNMYFEPFLGGGSVFFYLMPERAIISDINRDLINTYRVMKRAPAQLRAQLEEHQNNHDSEHYYNVRNNIPEDSIARAARFLYLNRTCFNGMYRVNRNGRFNVPIGTRNLFIEDVAEFEEYSQVLHNVHIRSQDFVETIRNFEFMLSKLCETANELLPVGDIILIPDGPKPLIFAMSLVPDIIKKNGVTCLHITRNNDYYEAVDAMPSGGVDGFVMCIN